MVGPEEPTPPAQSTAHSTAQHMLGPHVVGQRVVVRRLLAGPPGPTGGPAMTDLLGICTDWDAEARTCTVQPETGPPVLIALGDIVSGKPVPPRPSMRHRISPADAQHRAMALFPDGRSRPLGEQPGGWTLRWSDVDTARRANSVLAMTAPGPGVGPEQVAAAYAELGRRPIAAVLRDSPEEAGFLAAGWVPESDMADTVFEITSVAMAVRTPAMRAARAGEVELVPDGPDFVTARVGDPASVMASGVAVFDRDWVGFRGIEVSPDHRHRGLGAAVMSALLEWAAEQGASTAYLQVVGDNGAALAMYAALGFVPHHGYRYLATPDPV